MRDPFGDLREAEIFRRTVHLPEFLLVGSIQRRDDQIERKQFLQEIFIGEGKGVCQQTEFDFGMVLFDEFDDFSDARMQSRLACSRKGDVIDMGMGIQFFIDLRNGEIGGKIFLAFRGQRSRFSAFAVDAVHGARFERDQIDTEGDPETPGGDRSENT